MPTTYVNVGGRRVKLSDVTSYWLYDTETISSGTTGEITLTFFRSPAGKDIYETNMQQFSTLPRDWQLEVNSIRLVPNPKASLDDIELIFGSGQPILTFYRGGMKEEFTVPAILCNAGCGIYGAVCTTSTDTTKDIVSLGFPSDTAKLRLPVRILLLGGETFNMIFRVDLSSGTSADVYIKCILEGVLKRGVV